MSAGRGTCPRPAGCPRWNAVSKQATWGTPGSRCRDRLDGAEVVGLMQRSQRHELAELLQDLGRHYRGTREARAPVHDPVPDPQHPRAAVARAEPDSQPVQGGAPVAHVRVEGLVGEALARLTLRGEARRGPDPLDLAARLQVPGLGRPSAPASSSCTREVGEGGEERRELHRQRDAHRRACTSAHHLDRSAARPPARSAPDRWPRDRGSAPGRPRPPALDEPGVVEPAARGRAVERGDHRASSPRPSPAEVLEVLLRARTRASGSGK